MLGTMTKAVQSVTGDSHWGEVGADCMGSA
jgi:hypothetical protein